MRTAPSDDAGDERLAEEHRGEGDGEERRHPDRRRGPRRAGVANREGEQHLRDARPEDAGERERPDRGDVPVAGDRGRDERDAERRERR